MLQKIVPKTIAMQAYLVTSRRKKQAQDWGLPFATGWLSGTERLLMQTVLLAGRLFQYGSSRSKLLHKEYSTGKNKAGCKLQPALLRHALGYQAVLGGMALVEEGGSKTTKNLVEVDSNSSGNRHSVHTLGHDMSICLTACHVCCNFGEFVMLR